MNKHYYSDINETAEKKYTSSNGEESRIRKKSPNKEKEKKEKKTTEPYSATAFSSEQEQEYTGKVQKLTNVLTNALTAPATQDPNKSKFADFKDRTVWTIIMLLAFFMFISAGPFYCALLVLIIITCIFNELKDLSKYVHRNEAIKNFQVINWIFYIVCIYFFYISLLKNKITYLTHYHPIIQYIFKYHNLISFGLYLVGFIVFILSLTKGYYRYQFRYYAWNHLILLIFGVQSSLIQSNIFNGLVWFILPASLVICNDITAYIWGRMFGRNSLSDLSPKKTWEGFIGALLSTIIFSYYFSSFLSRFDFMLCPMNNITAIPYVQLECDSHELTSYVSASVLGLFDVQVKNIQYHAFFLSLFASLLAPLGGLFASGFKRSIEIKDFAQTIPGHGGLTDRMDCQILMGIFTYVWVYHFVIHSEARKFNSVMSMLKLLTNSQKMEVYNMLTEALFTTTSG